MRRSGARFERASCPAETAPTLSTSSWSSEGGHHAWRPCWKGKGSSLAPHETTGDGAEPSEEMMARRLTKPEAPRVDQPRALRRTSAAVVAALCVVGCQHASAPFAAKRPPGAPKDPSVGESRLVADAGADSEATRALHVPPPAPAPAAPRERSCQDLGAGAIFCQEARDDWTRILVRWSPGQAPDQTPLTPEEGLLLSRWLERSLVEQVGPTATDSLLLLSPSSPTCSGAWLCFWVEPMSTQKAVVATLTTWTQPQVGEFYLARLDAAANWEAATREAEDPRAFSSLLFFDSSRAARFEGRNTFSAAELSHALGSAWIRRLEWKDAAKRLQTHFAGSKLDVTGPLPPTLRQGLEESVLSWKARSSNAAFASAGVPSMSGRSEQGSGAARTERTQRMVLVEDESAQQARLVLTIAHLASLSERESLLEAWLDSFELPAGVRLLPRSFPRNALGVREFLGSRQELEAMSVQLGRSLSSPATMSSAGTHDVAGGERSAAAPGEAAAAETRQRASWLGVLWTPPPVQVESSEDGPQSP